MWRIRTQVSEHPKEELTSHTTRLPSVEHTNPTTRPPNADLIYRPTMRPSAIASCNRNDRQFSKTEGTQFAQAERDTGR